MAAMDRARSTPTPGVQEPDKDAAASAGMEVDDELMSKFRKYDKNGDGRLSFGEFRELLASEGLSTYMPYITFFLLDQNADGKIDCIEFARFAKMTQTPLLQAPPKEGPVGLKRLVSRVVGEPRFLNELVFDSTQTAGSHLGAFFHSDNGQKFYVKFPGIPPVHDDDATSKSTFAALMESPRDFYAVEAERVPRGYRPTKQSALVRRQTKSEVLVSKLYAMVGIEAAVMRLVYIEGAEEDGPIGCWSRNQDYQDIGQREMPGLPGLKEGFAADAWLANWDVIGNGAPDELNLKRTKTGRAFRLDFGGCLQYRAQGSDKSTAGSPFVADSVAELASLRKFNYPFKDITEADIAAGVEKIAAIPDEAIRDVVNDVLGKDAVYNDTTIADVLIGRKEALRRQFPPPAPPPASVETPPASTEISAGRSAAFDVKTARDWLRGAFGGSGGLGVFGVLGVYVFGVLCGLGISACSKDFRGRLQWRQQ